MTRLDFLKLVVARARCFGFEFRRWYTSRLGLPWISAAAALQLLDSQRRYYALLFSHEFARAFWAPGSDIFLALPAQTFESVRADGSVHTVTRKPHMRRSVRREAWKYHLRQMAVSEEPLRYLRRFVHIEDALEDDPAPEATPTRSAARPSKEPRARVARPLPTGTPAFLKRPYHGSGKAASTPAAVAPDLPAKPAESSAAAASEPPKP